MPFNFHVGLPGPFSYSHRIGSGGGLLTAMIQLITLLIKYFVLAGYYMVLGTYLVYKYLFLGCRWVVRFYLAQYRGWNASRFTLRRPQ